jgi:hypothetical protein
MTIIRGNRLVHFGKIADIYFSLTVEFADKRTTYIDVTMNSFQHSFRVNCFFETKIGEHHQTLAQTRGKNIRFDERRNLIGPAPKPQAKFVKFFTISAALMQLISFSFFG